MFLSIFEIFKVSVGPSSSHTMGPMIAATRFVDELASLPLPAGELSLSVSLYGSLAYTGDGHGTFRAVLCGLMGMTPESYDRDAADTALAALAHTQRVRVGARTVRLDPEAAIVAERGKRLAAHPNAMTFRLLDDDGQLVHSETYFSVGGGFVMTEGQMQADQTTEAGPHVPFPFSTAAEMLAMGKASGLTIAQMKRANEAALRDASSIDTDVLSVWHVMSRCIDRGLAEVNRRGIIDHDFDAVVALDQREVLASRRNVDQPRLQGFAIDRFARRPARETADMLGQ